MDQKAGLLIGCGKKVKFRGIFRHKIAEKSADFDGNFGANLAGKQSVKNSRFCGYFLREKFIITNYHHHYHHYQSSSLSLSSSKFLTTTIFYCLRNLRKEKIRDCCY